MRQIYLHGLGQTPTNWKETIMRLKSEEYSVCPNLADLVRDQDVTYLNLYSAFLKLCNSLEEKAIDLCGLSLGGVLALNYAIDYPERVHSLVLIATQYKMPKKLLRLQNIIFQFMPETMFLQTGFGKLEFLQLCKTMAELDFATSIQKVICPTLVICGEKDTANKKAAMELADALVHAEFQTINGSGHEVNVDAPEELAEILHDFYDRA